MPRTCTACSHEHRNEIRLLPEEMEARGSTSSELDDRPLNTVTDVLLLRILAREPGMTEANFLRIARGRADARRLAPACSLRCRPKGIEYCRSRQAIWRYCVSPERNGFGRSRTPISCAGYASAPRLRGLLGF